MEGVGRGIKAWIYPSSVLFVSGLGEWIGVPSLESPFWVPSVRSVPYVKGSGLGWNRAAGLRISSRQLQDSCPNQVGQVIPHRDKGSKVGIVVHAGYTL